MLLPEKVLQYYKNVVVLMWGSLRLADFLSIGEVLAELEIAKVSLNGQEISGISMAAAKGQEFEEKNPKVKSILIPELL